MAKKKRKLARIAAKGGSTAGLNKRQKSRVKHLKKTAAPKAAPAAKRLSPGARRRAAKAKAREEARAKNAAAKKAARAKSAKAGSTRPLNSSKTATRGKKGKNKSQIKDLKNQLKNASTGAEYDSIAKQIKDLGGKFKDKKFPRPGGDSTVGPDGDVTLGGKDKAKLDEELVDSTIAGGVADRDLDIGIDLGNKLAPDVTDGEFLDRIDANGQDRINQTFDNFDADRQRALTDSDELSFTLDTLKQKALTGFTPQEREALSFNARTSINQGLQSGLRAAQGFNMGRGIQGNIASAAFNPAISTAVTQRRGLENDIMLAEMAEKARALSEFGGITERRDQNRSTNLLNQNTAAGTLATNNNLYTSDIDKFNAGQLSKEIAARTAKNAAGLGIQLDEKDTQSQDQLLQDQLKSSEKALQQALKAAV